MASITISSGKFAVYRTDKSDGSVPYVNILAEDDGAACALKDSTGKVWIFRINNHKVQYKRSTDTEGITLTDDTWHDIEIAGPLDGIPTAIELPTGKIIVFYWKWTGLVLQWYQASTIDYGENWIIIEVTT